MHQQLENGWCCPASLEERTHLRKALIVHNGEVLETNALTVEVDEGEHESLSLRCLNLLSFLEEQRHHNNQKRSIGTTSLFGHAP